MRELEESERVGGEWGSWEESEGVGRRVREGEGESWEESGRSGRELEESEGVGGE